MKATINFNTNKQANEFATQWGRKSMSGHTVSGKSVSIYGITEDLKTWIDSYIYKLNK
jgi:hypothetical protein